MSKLSIGLWCNNWSRMFWIRSTEKSKKKWGRELTKEEYERYNELYDKAKVSDSEED